MSAWKGLVAKFNEVFTSDAKSEQEKEYDKVAERVMKDTKHITNVLQGPPEYSKITKHKN